MPRSDRKKRPAAAMRTITKALIALRGRASGSVRISARLTGTAADLWRGLHEAATGLKVDNSLLVVMLLVSGAPAVRDALLDAPRED